MSYSGRLNTNDISSDTEDLYVNYTLTFYTFDTIIVLETTSVTFDRFRMFVLNAPINIEGFFLTEIQNR